ncbi:MAG: GTP 3',8-cyclase MoaA, partial [Promethearchaeota archaeon]
MKDSCNREIKHLRFSITSNCNYNCIYCDKEGFIPKTTELTVEEIVKLCKILGEILNVTRIKFTGGEPLCRKEVIEIIKRVNDLGLYKDISLTTNGFFLAEKARQLREAGLNRINVSLGSLRPATYEKICGFNTLHKVLKGLTIAKEVGFEPIKINFVVLKGINDIELNEMIEFCGENEFILQLIELHEISKELGENGSFYKKHHVDLKPIISELEKKAIEIKTRVNMQNRKVLKIKTPKGNSVVIETIVPSHEFCMGCTKLRVGCDGNLFGCLFRSDLGTNVKEALKNHCSIAKYEEIVRKVVESRTPFY